MLRMLTSINRDFVGKIEKPHPVKVDCVTCHRGLTQPRQLKDVLEEAIEQRGVNAAIALYQDLRKQYSTSGQYDFGETTLNQVAEWLLAQDKNREAVQVMEMNFATNGPQSVWAYHMLAMAYEAVGDKAKAAEAFRRVIELHPEDAWAKEQSDRLAAGK